MLRAACCLLLLTACRVTVPPGGVREQLLALHEAQRRTHVEEDAAAMVALFDESFFDIRDGVLQQPMREAGLARLQRYFDAVEFLAWDDLEPPRIEIARDGSMATMAVQKLVRVRTVDAEGAAHVERTIFAWVATCVQREAGWRIASVVSTRRPKDAAASLAALHRALGGEASIARLRKASAAYACSGPSGSYRLEMELPREDAWRMRWIFPGRPEQRFELLGKQGWSVDGDGTRAALGTAEFAALCSHAFPWLVLDPARCFSSMVHAGERLDSGRTLERLTMVDAAGQAAIAEIDLSNDLLAGLELADSRAQPPAQIRIRFESWRPVDGLMLPERVVALDAGGTWILELDSVRLEFDPE